MQQVAGLIVVALHDVAIVVGVLTDACTVDADVAGETDVDIGVGECSLISGLGLIESLEGIVPGRTEGYQ